MIEGVFNPDQKRAIVDRLTEAMVAIEGENMRSVTWVVLEEVGSGDWAIDGKALSPTTSRRWPQVRPLSHESIVSVRQAPLRRLYADHPRQALTSKKARTSSARVPASDPFHGEVEIGEGYGASLRFGLDRHVGGLHDAPNPGDLLCAALAACADGAIRMVADLLAIRLTALEVEVSGELDVRGCLGVGRDVRIGFETLSCTAHLAAVEGTDRKRLDALVASAERVCVNLDTLRGGIEVATTAEIAGGGA